MTEWGRRSSDNRPYPKAPGSPERRTQQDRLNVEMRKKVRAVVRSMNPDDMTGMGSHDFVGMDPKTGIVTAKETYFYAHGRDAGKLGEKVKSALKQYGNIEAEVVETNERVVRGRKYTTYWQAKLRIVRVEGNIYPGSLKIEKVA